MLAEKIVFRTVRDAAEAIDLLGASHGTMMPYRAVHVNVLIRQIPGTAARSIKTAYNDVGAEAAISSQAYHREEEAVTDMIAMGTVYQHREVKRVLQDDPSVQKWLQAIEQVVDNSPEVKE